MSFNVFNYVNFNNLLKSDLINICDHLGVDYKKSFTKQRLSDVITNWHTQTDCTYSNALWDMEHLVNVPYIVDALYIRTHRVVQTLRVPKSDIVFGLKNRKRWLERQNPSQLLRTCFVPRDFNHNTILARIRSNICKRSRSRVRALCDIDYVVRFILQLSVANFPGNAKTLAASVVTSKLLRQCSDDYNLQYFDATVRRDIADPKEFVEMAINSAALDDKPHYINHLATFAHLANANIILHYYSFSQSYELFPDAGLKEINPFEEASKVSFKTATLIARETTNNPRFVNSQTYLPFSVYNVVCASRNVYYANLLPGYILKEIANMKELDRDQIAKLFLTQTEANTTLVRSYFCIDDDETVFEGIAKSSRKGEDVLEKIYNYIDDCWEPSDYTRHMALYEIVLQMFKVEKTVDEECPVCLEEPADPKTDANVEDTFVKIACNHVFHYRCIAKWFSSSEDSMGTILNKKCPLCRKLIIMV